MSTILKALRRIEQERTRTAERPLRDEVVLAPTRARRRLGVAAVGVAALIGFAATLALLSRVEGEPPPAAPVSAAPTPPAAAPVPALVSAPPAAPEPSTSPPHVTAIVSAAVPAVPPPAAPPAVAAAPDRPGVTDEVIVPPLAHPVVRHWVDEDELDSPPARVAARPALSVQVVRTRWHPRAERRAAWIATDDGAEREVHEGEQVGSFVVREIDPDGVLFVDGRVEVRRAVGAP